MEHLSDAIYQTINTIFELKRKRMRQYQVNATTYTARNIPDSVHLTITLLDETEKGVCVVFNYLVPGDHDFSQHSIYLDDTIESIEKLESTCGGVLEEIQVHISGPWTALKI